MASPENEVTSLNRLYEDYWEFILKENPTLATYLGDHRYDNWLEDVSAEAYEKARRPIQGIPNKTQGLQKTHWWRRPAQL